MPNRRSNLRLVTEAMTRENGKARAVIVEWSTANPDLLTFRAAGLRTRYTLPAASLYLFAAQKEADRALREKRIAAKLRKEGKGKC